MEYTSITINDLLDAEHPFDQFLPSQPPSLCLLLLHHGYTICISRCFLKLLKHALFFFRRTNTYIHKHYCTISLLLHNLQCNLFVNLFNCKVSHFPGPAVSIMLRLKKMLVKQWRDTLYIYIPGYVYVSWSQRTTADFGFLKNKTRIPIWPWKCDCLLF